MTHREFHRARFSRRHNHRIAGAFGLREKQIFFVGDAQSQRAFTSGFCA